MVTPLNVQGAGVCLPKLSRLFYALFALGAFQPLWMKMLKNPLGAIFFIKKFCDWEFHAPSLPLRGTPFTHEPKKYERETAFMGIGRGNDIDFIGSLFGGFLFFGLRKVFDAYRLARMGQVTTDNLTNEKAGFLAGSGKNSVWLWTAGRLERFELAEDSEFTVATGCAKNSPQGTEIASSEDYTDLL